jgi:hypothetical protein
MGFLVRRRLFMAPEPALRLVAGRRKRAALRDADAKAACGRLIKALGGDVETTVNLLATTGEREMAKAQAGHAPVYEFEIHLTPEESPRCGSGHGLDFARCFQADGPVFSAEQQRTACQAFFGRDTLGEEVSKVAEGLRDAIVRFASTGDPKHFNEVPWQGSGQLVVSTHPHFDAWPADGENPKRKIVREAIEALG